MSLFLCLPGRLSRQVTTANLSCFGHRERSAWLRIRGIRSTLRLQGSGTPHPHHPVGNLILINQGIFLVPAPGGRAYIPRGGGNINLVYAWYIPLSLG